MTIMNLHVYITGTGAISSHCSIPYSCSPLSAAGFSSVVWDAKWRTKAWRGTVPRGKQSVFILLDSSKRNWTAPLSHHPNWWPAPLHWSVIFITLQPLAPSLFSPPLHPPRCHPWGSSTEQQAHTGNDLLLAAIFPSAGLDRNVAYVGCSF